MDLAMEKRIVIKEEEDGRRIYASHYYYMEMNVARMLHDLNVHYEVAFVESVKAFYEQVLNGMPMGGVLIYDIAQNKNHEVYQIGDIIVEWNGERTNSLKELKQAYSKSSSGKLKLLRLDGDSLKKLEMVIPGNEDIVAFVDLVYQE